MNFCRARGHVLGCLLSFEQFFTDGGRVDLSEQRFESRLAIQEDPEVLGIPQVLYQRRIGQHRAEGSPQGVATGSVAAISFQIPEEPLHDIVGPLRLDGARTLRGGHDQRGGEQFGSVVINLLEHFLQNGCGRIVRTGPDLAGKGLNLLLKSLHWQSFALMIEASVCVDGSHPQGRDVIDQTLG